MHASRGTWVSAVRGVTGQRADHWSAGAPLTGWALTAIASVADSSLSSPVVYELWDE